MTFGLPPNSTIEDRSTGTRRLRKVIQRVEEKSRGYKGFNFFDDTDMKIKESVLIPAMNY